MYRGPTGTLPAAFKRLFARFIMSSPFPTPVYYAVSDGSLSRTQAVANIRPTAEYLSLQLCTIPRELFLMANVVVGLAALRFKPF